MKKETKRRLLDGLFNVAGARLITGLLHALAYGCRMNWQNEEGFRKAVQSGRPLIFVFWHEDMVAIAMHYIRERFGQLGVMVSRSRDGEKLARVLMGLGTTPIRGSSSRGAVAGVVEMVHYLKTPQGVPSKNKHPKNHHRNAAAVALALDGPRGPRRQAKPGVALIARKACAHVLPIAYAHSRQIVFKSWDRTKLPLPFSRMQIRVGPVMDILQWNGEEAAFAAQVEEELNRLHNA